MSSRRRSKGKLCFEGLDACGAPMRAAIGLRRIEYAILGQYSSSCQNI